MDNKRLDGKEIKRIRKTLGLSQVELAERLKISASCLASWELDYHSVPHAEILRLALKFLVRERLELMEKFI